METAELLAKVKRPPMYGTYYLVQKPSGWRLMLRTFVVVEVEWDTIAQLTSDQFNTLQEAGIPTWK